MSGSVVCHEHRQSKRRCATVREMKENSFEIGSQVLVSNHCKLLLSKAMVVSVAKTPGQDSAGKVERGERKRTVDEVSKSD